MSPALQRIAELSDTLVRLSGQRDWHAMTDIARQRQLLLEQYFALPSLPDSGELVRTTLEAIQRTDQQLLAGTSLQRQQLLADAVDLRQRWSSSNSYQSVQNLPPEY